MIVEENKGYATVLDRGYAPAISGLAKTYGIATQMFAERHPSEPNYVALLGGDTFGIADDDAWYCTPGSTRRICKGADAPGFAMHLIDGPNLATQLAAKHLGWRAYLENIPAPGSLAIVSPETDTDPAALYAAKHTRLHELRIRSRRSGSRAGTRRLRPASRRSTDSRQSFPPASPMRPAAIMIRGKGT